MNIEAIRDGAPSAGTPFASGDPRSSPAARPARPDTADARDAAALAAAFPRREGAQYWRLAPTGATTIACSGLATRTPPEPTTARTTFHCFSTTKVVTSLAVVQLVVEGRVRLDDPLIAYLPELPYRNGATIRQVLSHQAGLPNPIPLSWVHADVDHERFDAAAFLARVLREHPSCGRPGRRVRYSNVGFLLLGRLVETIAGVPYERYVRDRILDVVGCCMADGASLGFDLPPRGHATGYTRCSSPAGVLIALLPDTKRLRVHEGAWIRYRPFHLDGSAYGGLKGNVLGWAPLLSAIATRDPRLLPPNGYDALFTPQSLASGRPTGHALAWFTGRLHGVDYLCHAGGGPGYSAEIRVYPALRAASALLANTTAMSDTRRLDQLDAATRTAPRPPGD
jgi:CubicO group peptidase (beta-lactamase class C family)